MIATNMPRCRICQNAQADCISENCMLHATCYMLHVLKTRWAARGGGPAQAPQQAGGSRGAAAERVAAALGACTAAQPPAQAGGRVTSTPFNHRQQLELCMRQVGVVQDVACVPAMSSATANCRTSYLRSGRPGLRVAVEALVQQVLDGLGTVLRHPAAEFLRGTLLLISHAKVASASSIWGQQQPPS